MVSYKPGKMLEDEVQLRYPPRSGGEGKGSRQCYCMRVNESNIKLTVLIDLCSCDRILDHSIDNDDASLSMGIRPKLQVHSG